MKKIIFKLQEFPHLSETFIVAQIVTAIKLGYKVEILTGKLLVNANDLNYGLIEQYGLLDKIIIEDYKIPKNRFTRLFKWMMLLLINFKDIDFIVRFYKEYPKFSLTWLYQWHFYKQFNEVAIIHIQYGTNKFPIDILKKTGFFKPSVIVTFHGHDVFFPINGFIPNNGYYDNLFKYGNLITANTPYLAEKIVGLGCPKELLSLVPVGVDTDFFYPIKKQVVKDEKVKLITVGRLSVVKGHIYAFDVVKKLIKANYNILLTVIGEGNERINLENYIKTHNLFDSIVLVGAKSQEEIREFLWNSDIFMFPSVSLHYGKSTETQGLATIEAGACGLPVVVFNSGGVKYTLKDKESGFIVPEYNTEAMTSRIEELIKNVQLRKNMSNEAVTFVNENYAQKIIDEKWKTIYGYLSDGK